MLTLTSWVHSKSQTEKRCGAEVSRVAPLLEIMTECLNASPVEMTANQQHIHTHIHTYRRTLDLNTEPVLREAAITFSSPSSFPQTHLILTLPSIFHPLLYQPSSFLPDLQPPSSAFVLPSMTSPSLSILLSQRSLSHTSLSPLHRSCPHSSSLPASLSPDSHYSHSQTPVSCLLPLRIGSPLPHSAPARCLSLAPLLIYHLFVSDWLGWTLYLVNK